MNVKYLHFNSFKGLLENYGGFYSFVSLKKDYPETFLVIKARLILSENYEEASLLEQLVKCDTKYFLYIRFVEELGRQIPIFFPIQNRYEEIICKEILSRVLLPRDLFDTTNFEEFLIDVISEEKN